MSPLVHHRNIISILSQLDFLSYLTKRYDWTKVFYLLKMSTPINSRFVDVLFGGKIKDFFVFVPVINMGSESLSDANLLGFDDKVAEKNNFW